MNPAALRARAPELYKVRLTTTKGDVEIEVHRDWAPLGADRFYNLVKNGYFTNAAFFRVMPNFIVQFGMAANPAIGKVWQDAHIKDDPRTQSNKRGYVVFATAGPNTRSNQLFINLDGQCISRLPGILAVRSGNRGHGRGGPDLFRLRRYSRPGTDPGAGQGVPG